MDSKSNITITEHFSTLTDPRIQLKIQHKLIDIVVISLCALICGADDFGEIADFGKDPTISKIKSSFFSVNDAWYAQNKDATVEFLKMMMKGYQDTKADPTLVAPFAQENNVQYDAPQQAALVDELSGALDPTLSVDEATMNFTIQFYVSTGNIQTGLEVSQVLNLEPLQAASQ